MKVFGKYFWVMALFLPLLSALGEEGIPGKRPGKVVSLSPAITEIIFALGAGDALAGRSSACNYPAAAGKLPVMGDFGRPNRERILKSLAGKVFTNDLINPTLVKKYKSMGVDLVILPLTNEKEYFQLLKFLGRELGREKEAKLLAASLQEKLALLAENTKRFSAASPRKKALFLVWDKPLLAAGGSSLPERILTLTGLQNIASHVKSDYFKVSFEWMVKGDPYYIFFPGLTRAKLRQMESSPRWRDLRAVREGRLIGGLDEDLLFRIGPRWGDGLLLLQKRFLEAGKVSRGDEEIIP